MIQFLDDATNLALYSKIGMHFLFDPAISLLRFMPKMHKDMKIFILKVTYCSNICNSRRIKITKYPSARDWFNKLGYNQEIELFAAFKSEDRDLYILLWRYIVKSQKKQVRKKCM